MISWSFIRKSELLEGELKFNYDRDEIIVGFDSCNYRLNSIFAYMELTCTLAGEPFKFYMVKGFEPNSALRFQPTTKYDKVEDYFKQIPFSENTFRYYNFF